MKRAAAWILALLTLLTFASCGAEGPAEEPPAPSSGTGAASDPQTAEETAGEEGKTSPEDTAESGPAPETEEGSRTLVVYFSRTGEQYRVGVIEEGNTAIVAGIIAEKTGADLYEILPETDSYPYTYDELTDVAKREQGENARPGIRDPLPELAGYDTVFIGAPVWWGDWPMILYTFFESADLSGKDLVPFSTHEGSGLSGFDRKLAAAAPEGRVLEGLAVSGTDCQNDRKGVEEKVSAWLDAIGY